MVWILLLWQWYWKLSGQLYKYTFWLPDTLNLEKVKVNFWIKILFFAFVPYTIRWSKNEFGKQYRMKRLCSFKIVLEGNYPCSGEEQCVELTCQSTQSVACLILHVQYDCGKEHVYLRLESWCSVGRRCCPAPKTQRNPASISYGNACRAGYTRSCVGKQIAYVSPARVQNHPRNYILVLTYIRRQINRK